MSEILTNLQNVGLATTVIALITILLVGCIKLIPFVKNLSNSVVKKAIYFGSSTVIGTILSIFYHLVFAKGGWDSAMCSFILIVFGEVNTIYPIYENLGIRDLFKKIVSLIIPSKADKINEAVDTVADKLVSGENIQLTSEEVAKNQEEAEKTGWLK